eukprot:687166-Amphidinium_carterae.1
MCATATFIAHISYYSGLMLRLKKGKPAAVTLEPLHFGGPLAHHKTISTTSSLTKPHCRATVDECSRTSASWHRVTCSSSCFGFGQVGYTFAHNLAYKAQNKS